MPKTPKIPGGEKTTVFFSALNRAYLDALSAARGHPLIVVLGMELTYLEQWGVSTPVRQRLLADAKRQKVALREYVHQVLLEHAATLPTAAVRPPVTSSEEAIKTTITLAPEHHDRLQRIGAERGLNMSIVMNAELDFARTLGLPPQYLARLERQAQDSGIALRDLIQFLLIERFNTLPPEPSEPHTPARAPRPAVRGGK